MTATTTRWTITAALRDAGLSDALYERYRGRGMVGERCFGFTGDERDLARFMIAIARWDDDIACNLADVLRTEMMALETMYYFPGYLLADD